MLEHIRELFTHQAWAEAEMYRAMGGFPPMHHDRETLTKLHHIHTVQHMFLQIWRGDAPNHVSAKDFPTLASLRNYGQMTNELLEAHLAAVDPTLLDRVIHVPWFPGEPFQPMLWQTMHHNLSHSAYHRGQISSRIRHLGGEAPNVDYIHWLWKGKPKAVWV